MTTAPSPEQIAEIRDELVPKEHLREDQPVAGGKTDLFRGQISLLSVKQLQLL